MHVYITELEIAFLVYGLNLKHAHSVTCLKISIGYLRKSSVKRMMIGLILFTILCVASSIRSIPHPNSHVSENFKFVSRSQWGGRPVTSVTPLGFAVPFVIIHHTYIPRACFSFQQCAAAMRSMQNSHQWVNGWHDIGYNFAVGSDGAVYEGRGWDVVGAHAVGFNTRSVGITLIGDWTREVPPAAQLETTQKLIREGVRLGYISKNYDLIGHRQVSATECPGQALFMEISTWERFRHSMN